MIPARANPFRVEKTDALAFRPPGMTWEDILQQLAELHYRAAVVGPDGTGKTTFLEQLAPRLESRGYGIKRLFLNDQAPSFPRGFLEEFLRGLGPRDIVLFDGPEFLNRRAWRKVKSGTQPAGGLVIAVHEHGMLPTLFETETSVELLHSLVRELLDDEKCSDVLPLKDLYEKHHGNLRDALRDLYDRFAAGEFQV